LSFSLIEKLKDILSLKNNSKTKQINHDKMIRGIQRLLGYPVKNKELFLEALAHRSYVETFHDIPKSNERLEFLGDSILGFIVGKFLFENFPGENEGFLTKYRSYFVNKNALAKTAREMELENLVLYNKRFIKPDSEGLNTVLADCLEALTAAVYFDAGMEKTEEFVRRWIIDPHFDQTKNFVDTNYKGQLLEYSHAHKIAPPVYKILKEEGPAHKKKYVVQVKVGDKILGTGEGNNKKNAEQSAAKEAFLKLKAQEKPQNN